MLTSIFCGDLDINFVITVFDSNNHGHKMEDCVALKIEVNGLVKKGHLRKFLSEKAKSHLS